MQAAEHEHGRVLAWEESGQLYSLVAQTDVPRLTPSVTSADADAAARYVGAGELLGRHLRQLGGGELCLNE